MNNKPHSDETRRKISESLKGNIPWNKGKGKIKPHLTAEEIRYKRGESKRGDKNPARRPEVREIADVLEEMNIFYVHNYRIDRYFADFVIFDKIVIECDGKYWHRDKNKEKVRDKVLHDNGYYVFHLEETRIKNDPVKCVNVILGICRLFEDAGWQ